MNKFIYIHGWGSSGDGETASLFKTLIPDLIAPTLDYNNPLLALNTLLALVDSFAETDETYIIASSHGGYFAELVANKRIVNVIFYNPSLDTANVKRLSNNPLLQYDRDELKLPSKPSIWYSTRNVVLCTDDDVVPHTIAEEYFSNFKVVLTSGGHRMTRHNAAIIIALLNRMTCSI